MIATSIYLCKVRWLIHVLLEKYFYLFIATLLHRNNNNNHLKQLADLLLGSGLFQATRVTEVQVITYEKGSAKEKGVIVYYVHTYIFFVFLLLYFKLASTRGFARVLLT